MCYLFTELINSKLPPVPEEQGSDGMAFKSIGWMFPEYQVAAGVSDFTTSESGKLTSFNNELVINYPNEEIQETHQTNMAFNPSVISKTNSNKQKNITQQHIKLVSNQAQLSIYKQPAEYLNYSLNELNNKPVIILNPDSQTSTNITIPQDQDKNRRYKFTTTENIPSSNFKFTAQVTTNNDFILPDTPQLIPISRQDITHAKSKDMARTVIKSEGNVAREKVVQRRPRSRSTTREPQQRPPLLTAVSDPAIINTNNSSALLTQLLTTRRSSMTAVLSSSSADPGSAVLIKHEDSVALLPVNQSPVTTLIITKPPTSTVDNMIHSSNSPLDQSSKSLDSPESPNSSISIQNMIGSPCCDSTSPNRDRRVGHIHAEQKRRYNIKNGFDMIHSLIPQLNQNPNAKLSKAAMLQKGADYIRQLRSERNQLKEEMDALKQQIECLNTSISNCQSMLPATGAPVSRRRDSKMQEMFDEYVRRRTLDNWKFWIFSMMVKPLLSSYNNFVSTSSLEDLYRSTMLWVEQHCTLVDLRPIVLNSLRYLCTKTDILAHPERLPEEARQAVLSTRPAYP